jgi:hypothetical protein
MIIEKTGYSYNDLTIIPSVISEVSSRSECDPFIKDNFLPIFASPMASVVNEENLNKFMSNGIIPILPRNINIERRKYQMENGNWVALSLKEFEFYFIEEAEKRQGNFRTAEYFICVDIANGHMQSLYSKCHEAKKLSIKYGYKLTIMTGNIANPQTYRWICELNYASKVRVIDYIRVGIGGGSGCITTSNCSIHYPQASLIDVCYQEKCSLSTMHDDLGEPKYDESLFPKIVADGAIRNYDHVIKALALGADYVMIGSLFAQCIESAGEKSNKEINQKVPLRFPVERYCDFEIDANGNWWAYYTDEAIEYLSKEWKNEYDNAKKEYKNNDIKFKAIEANYFDRVQRLKEKKFIGTIDVKFFGMASADGQKSISGKKTKTAEGITKYLPVKYTLKGWTENMISYLCSAMSYCNTKTLNEFIGFPDLIPNSISEIQAVNK